MSDLTEVTQLVLRERQSRDRGWWEEMEGCFHPDSRVDLSWFSGSGPDFVSGSKAMAARGVRTAHRVSAPVGYVSAARAVVEAPVAIDVRFLIDDVEAELVSYTRLLYRAELRHDQWRIAALTAIYERDTLTPVIPGTALRLDLDAINRHRKPYRFLAFHLGLHGGTIHDDLHGDDRPDDVAELYREAFAWMRG